MFRTTLTLAAAATICGLAHADEPTTVTAKLTYEPAKLATFDGATETLASLNRQARRACRSISLVSAGFSYDETCAKSLVENAVSEIGHENLAETYAALEAVESAS
ncbi:MAG: UrcA family protein [Hyphomonadaceae bacterium]|nr:UrcA family protein [Hyphomonadaceae bacterium]